LVADDRFAEVIRPAYRPDLIAITVTNDIFSKIIWHDSSSLMLEIFPFATFIPSSGLRRGREINAEKFLFLREKSKSEV
jgi:hypothetical protein